MATEYATEKQMLKELLQQYIAADTYANDKRLTKSERDAWQATAYVIDGFMGAIESQLPDCEDN